MVLVEVLFYYDSFFFFFFGLAFHDKLLFATSGVKFAQACSRVIRYIMPIVTQQSDLTSIVAMQGPHSLVRSSNWVCFGPFR